MKEDMVMADIVAMEDTEDMEVMIHMMISQRHITMATVKVSTADTEILIMELLKLEEKTKLKIHCISYL